MRLILLCVLAVGCLIACQPTPTPLPVDILPEETPTLPIPNAASPQPLRYALDANTAGLVADDNLMQIRASAQVETLAEPVNPADLGARYDLIAGYGDLPGGARSPLLTHVALVINPARPPLDDPALAGVVRQAVHPDALVSEMQIPGVEASPVESAPDSQLRLELANAGWPDGFNLALGYVALPGAQAILAQFATFGIGGARPMDNAEIQAGLSGGRLDAAVIGWRTPEERQSWAALAGEANVIDLYTLPISYLAVDGINVTFTADGWPLINR